MREDGRALMKDSACDRVVGSGLDGRGMSDTV